ncbi:MULTISPECIES: class I SAM-dependent methyltransferase [Streptomyces]|uniref:Methyltransferase domain-containing protein n=1 Tax=Streptomyces evansiae TaxID=3075535 RepID=A0ABU2R2T8_9ACTN|nr:MULTISPECIES: methyltransferase domain-containing protein [unclassified Streptomyces]MDT0411011.1 methyltransferase domain-containing protein [Streptomyces sp. DSM 41979]MYQ58038.1 methyltransferase domain-containing protein [Streptomyces sp. SID4926]SCE46857.1 Predicted SAM-depedendent methyltransferase [Streptomyces sp. DfronAA-171]
MSASAMPSIDLLGEQIAAVLADPTTTHGLARALRSAAREIELHRYHRTTHRTRPSNQVGDRIAKVQIGGGAHRIAGFFNIDLVPPADLLWDIREGIPLQDNSTDEIFSEHFLEHIDYPRSAKHYAREVHRVLAPEGHVITGVPDAAFALSQYPRPLADNEEMLERWYSKRDCRGDVNTRLDLVNLVFRDQDDDPTYTPHLWAYDEEKLVQLFTEAGFGAVEPWAFDPTMANPKRRWGSVYVVATK